VVAPASAAPADSPLLCCDIQDLGYPGAVASNGRVEFRAAPEALARCNVNLRRTVHEQDERMAGEMRVEACLAGDSRNSTCGRIGICVQSRYGSQVGLLWKSQAGSDEILHSETGVQFQIGQKPKGNVLPAGRWRRCTSFITVSRRHWALFLPVVSAVGYPSGFWWPSLLMGARHRLGCGSGDSAMSGGWLLPLPGQSPQFARPGVGSISCYM